MRCTRVCVEHAFISRLLLSQIDNYLLFKYSSTGPVLRVPDFLREVITAAFSLGFTFSESVKAMARRGLIYPASQNPSFHLPFILLLDVTRMIARVLTPAPTPKHSPNEKGRGKPASFCTELAEGIRSNVLPVSMFWITSDPVSYSQPIISFQLSQHLFSVSRLL